MLGYKKNPGKKQVSIQVDGKFYFAKYLGKGQFSKVYRVGDRVVYYTKGDCSKEVLAMYQYERMTHLPELVRHENLTTRPGVVWYVFSSPYYRDVRKSDRSAYELMKEIIRYYSAYFDIAYQRDKRQDAVFMYSIVSMMRDYSSLPKSVIRAMEEIVNISSNCGGAMGFDLHPKNFGVNEYGTLIFRDPVWVGE
jgi:hypothetical protein